MVSQVGMKAVLYFGDSKDNIIPSHSLQTDSCFGILIITCLAAPPIRVLYLMHLSRDLSKAIELLNICCFNLPGWHDSQKINCWKW